MQATSRLTVQSPDVLYEQYTKGLKENLGDLDGRSVAALASTPKDAFESVPLDVLTLILSKLSPRDLVKTMQVCTRWLAPSQQALVYRVNAHPDQPLKKMGPRTVDRIKSFVQIYGENLTSLNLTYFPDLNGEDFKEIVRYCPKLTHLDLRSRVITNDDLAALDDKPLVSLTFNDCSNINDTGFTHFKKMPLESLLFYRIAGGGFTGEGLAYLKSARLKSIIIHSSNFTDSALQHLAGFTDLTVARFPSCNLTGSGFEHLQGMTKLAEIDVLGNLHFDNRGLLYLANSPIEVFDCSFTRCTGKGLVGLWPNLRTFRGGYYIPGFVGGNELLSNLKDKQQLNMLDFSRGEITDEGIKHLEGKPISSLNIHSRGITDASVPILMEMPLTFVKVEATRISPEKLRKLFEAARARRQAKQQRKMG